VILTSYDIVKAHGGELKLESPTAGLSAEKAGEAGEGGNGLQFMMIIPI
jgi:hypothetical protein